MLLIFLLKNNINVTDKQIKQCILNITLFLSAFTENCLLNIGAFAKYRGGCLLLISENILRLY